MVKKEKEKKNSKDKEEENKKENSKKEEKNLKEEKDSSEDFEEIPEEFESKDIGFSESNISSKPFLEPSDEPVTNLERFAQNISSSTNDIKKDTPMLYNAPQYGGGYTTNSYEPQKRTPQNMENGLGVSLMRTETTISPEKRIDFQRWQGNEMSGRMNENRMQEEQYVRAPERLKEDTGLPFQKKRKPF
jgi:hypothetical protein